MGVLNDVINWLKQILTWWVIVMPWERGLRIRNGKNVTLMKEGIYLKLPIVDSIYIQTTRERYVSLPVQTITSADGKTLSISSCSGYTIDDIEALYRSLYQPEMTIANIVLGAIAEYVASNDLANCTPVKIEESVSGKLNNNTYGIGNVTVKIIGYAVVKTYRLIQDSHWVPEGMRLDQKAITS